MDIGFTGMEYGLVPFSEGQTIKIGTYRYGVNVITKIVLIA